MIVSQRFRDAGRNAADCVAKLLALLVAVAVGPRPRRPTRPGRGAIQRRLETKRAVSEKAPPPAATGGLTHGRVACP